MWDNRGGREGGSQGPSTHSLLLKPPLPKIGQENKIGECGDVAVLLVSVTGSGDWYLK